MNEAIEYLIGQVKEQYYWRAEESECSVLETEDGWSLKESELLSEIQKITTSNSDYTKLPKVKDPELSKCIKNIQIAIEKLGNFA